MTEHTAERIPACQIMMNQSVQMKRQTEQNIDKDRVVWPANRLLARTEKKFGEQRVRTSTKLKNSESEAIGTGSGLLCSPGICSQVIILSFIENTLIN